MTFQRSLEIGRTAESQIANWLMRRGCLIMPVYELSEQRGKGPQVFSIECSYVAPDMLALKPGGKVFFVEAKCKTGFTWSRTYQRFETGIDKRHYRDYLAIREKTGVPLWILFLQKGGAVKDAPPHKPDSPRGLFGNEITTLAERISHEHDGWGKSGMVYWSPDYPGPCPALKLVAKYEDVCHMPKPAMALDEWA
jgi:hypothetical protein